MTKTTAEERVAREDVVALINACFACTGQREFYGDAKGQSVSIDFLHRYVLGNYRRLYARTLAAGINHFNQARIVVNLLATGRDTLPEQRQEEGALIAATLRSLPPQRVYRAFAELRRRRVNNRRTRAVIRDYLAGRPDPIFDAVKYRNKVRAAAAHAHLGFADERGAFLFGAKTAYDTELFELFRQAHFSKSAIYQLPYTVAEGLAERQGVPRAEFLSRIQPRLTSGERLRLQRSATAAGQDIEVDLGRAPITRLSSYILSLPVEQRISERTHLERALESSAASTLRRAPCRLGRVAAILDRSYSSSGSSEKRRRPLAVTLAASQLLRRAAREYRALWTPTIEDELAVFAHGATDLATPMLDALEWSPDLVVVVSDGWENDPPGAVAEVVRVYRARLDRDGRTSIVHMNPVFDAERLSLRTIGGSIPTVGLRDASDVPTMLGFARFADGSASLAELENYLEKLVQQMLSGGSCSPSPVEAR